MKLTTDEIIEGFRNKDNEVIRYVHDKSFNSVKMYVKMQNGSEDDAVEVFQQGMIAVFIRIRKGDLKIEDGKLFNDYLFIICRNIWLNELRLKKYKNMLNDAMNFDFIEEKEKVNWTEDLEYQALVRKDERIKLYKRYFKKLDKDCRKVLELYLGKLSYKKIAKELNISYDYVRLKKMRCLKKLLKMIKGDENYEHLKIKKNGNIK